MKLQTIFGSSVRNHRKAIGLTQEQLAERVDVSMETIGKIERGAAAPTFATAERIADALEVSVLDLFTTGAAKGPQGERGRLLSRIERDLSTMNLEQLARCSRILAAFLGH